MKRGKNPALAAGLAMLLISAFWILPVIADPLPAFDLTIKMVADKAEYNPGEAIAYQIWADYYHIDGRDFDHCDFAQFTLDSNIQNINHNMPDYCSVSGNTVTCQDLTNTYKLWYLVDGYHDWLPAEGISHQTHGVFTITGTISEDVPECTLIRSTAAMHGFLDEAGESVDDHATSVTRIRGEDCPPIYSPEFPTLFLPVMLILGFLWTVLYARKAEKQ